jgi:hypothetical protein
LARVVLNGKVGFIDRTGNFAIEPIFDLARGFRPGVGRTSAKRDGIVGAIDKAGSWVFQTNYQQIDPAFDSRTDPKSAVVFGWHFKKGDRWGLLNLDGRVVSTPISIRPSRIAAMADCRLTRIRNGSTSRRMEVRCSRRMVASSMRRVLAAFRRTA